MAAPMAPGVGPHSTPLLLDPCPEGFQLTNVQGQWVCAPVTMSQHMAAFQLMIDQGGDPGVGGPFSVTREPKTHLKA